MNRILGGNAMDNRACEMRIRVSLPLAATVCVADLPGIDNT